MSSYSFGDLYRTVKLYASAAPTFLCREWVNVAYKQLAQTRSWGFLRAEMRLRTSASKTLTSVVVTQDSATVILGAGMTDPLDAGRQFRVGAGSVYTILEVVDANTYTLDQVYAEDSAATASATIYTGYLTMPADFGSFRVIGDLANQRTIAFWLTEDQVLQLDPTRTSGDAGFRVLIARAYSTFPATLGRVQYETWPRPTAARSYPALYNRQADRLDDTDSLTGVLADGGEVLIAGALAQAASWPGTNDLPNLYFNRGVAQDKRTEFMQGIQRLALKDDNIYPDDLATVNWARWPVGDLAYNDVSLRSSDAGLDAYF